MPGNRTSLGDPEVLGHLHHFLWEELFGPLLEDPLEHAIENATKIEEDDAVLGLEKVNYSASRYEFQTKNPSRVVVSGTYCATVELAEGTDFSPVLSGFFRAEFKLSGPIGDATSLRCKKVDVSPR